MNDDRRRADADAAEAEAEAEAAERDRRRRLLFITILLLVGLPLYLYAAGSLVAWLNPPAIEDGAGAGRQWPFLVELLIYIGLGAVWAFPLKRLVMGLGRR